MTTPPPSRRRTASPHNLSESVSGEPEGRLLACSVSTEIGKNTPVLCLQSTISRYFIAVLRVHNIRRTVLEPSGDILRSYVMQSVNDRFIVLLTVNAVDDAQSEILGIGGPWFTF